MADVEMDSASRRSRAFDQAIDGANGRSAGESSSDWPARSVEGWIVIVTGLNEETTEEDLQDLFGEYGEVKNLSMALNRRTGYVMGYALVEYSSREEAEKAIKGTTGTTFLEKAITTEFAFSKGPAGGRRAAPRPRGGRDRSNSPVRR